MSEVKIEGTNDSSAPVEEVNVQSRDESQPAPTFTDEMIDISKCAAEVLASQAGKIVFGWLSSMFVKGSPFIMSDYSGWGGIANYLFFHHGAANVIKLVEDQARSYHTKSNPFKTPTNENVATHE